MLTLRDCIVIATLFALLIAGLMLHYDTAHFVFVPPTYAAWLFCVRRRSVTSPLARIALAALMGAVFEVVLVMLYFYIVEYHTFPWKAVPKNFLGMMFVLLTANGLCGGLFLGLLAELALWCCRPRSKNPA